MIEEISLSIYKTIYPFDCDEAQSNGHICNCPDRVSYKFMCYMYDEGTVKELLVDDQKGRYVIDSQRGTNLPVCQNSDDRLNLLGAEVPDLPILVNPLDKTKCFVLFKFFPLMMSVSQKFQSRCVYLEDAGFFVDSFIFWDKFCKLMEDMLNNIINGEKEEQSIHNLSCFLQNLQILWGEKQEVRDQTVLFFDLLYKKCSFKKKNELCNELYCLRQYLVQDDLNSDFSEGLLCIKETVYVERFAKLLTAVREIIGKAGYAGCDELQKSVYYFLIGQQVDLQEDDVLKKLDFDQNNFIGNVEILRKYLYIECIHRGQ